MILASHADLAAAKASLRAQALKRRDALPAADRERWSASMAAQGLALPELSGGPVGCYWPMRSEADPRPLIEGLAARRIACALPVFLPDGSLAFRAWQPGAAIGPAGFGTQGPQEGAEMLRPRVFVVPLCAFDRGGGRLGYGKGHFDRALAAFGAQGPIVVIGLAFAAQEMDRLPQEPHDRRLDMVLTENGPIRIGLAATPDER